MQYMWCAVLVFTWVHQLQEQHNSILVTAYVVFQRLPGQDYSSLVFTGVRLQWPQVQHYSVLLTLYVVFQYLPG